MRRLSVRRSDRSSGWLPVAAGVAIGVAAGIAARLVLGGLDRRRLQALVTGGGRPKPASSRVMAERISEALHQALGSVALDLEVVPVRPGRMELHGWVPSRTAGARAMRLAAEAAPDTDIANRLRVRGEDDLPAPDLVADTRLPA